MANDTDFTSGQATAPATVKVDPVDFHRGASWLDKIRVAIRFLRRPHHLGDFVYERLPRHVDRPDWGKEAFLRTLAPDCRIADIGCGNDSPAFTKSILPGCHYIGLDVGDYNQSSSGLAEEYVVVPPEAFRGAIEKLEGSLDALISAHNLEHCDDRAGTLDAMARALKPGRRAYVSFPSAATVAFPKRKGTLNYHDDATHKGTPPDFGEVISALTRNGLRIVYAASRYQPPIRWLIGLETEADSARDRELKSETWAFWGFEAIIWAERPSA